MDGAELTAPPRLLRAVCLQVAALGAVVLATDLPWGRHEARAPEPPPREVQRNETRIRVVRIAPPPRLAVARKEPEQQRPPPQQQQPAQPSPRPVPRKSVAQQQKPPPPNTRPAPHPSAEPRTRIAADSTSVQGVRMRVLVPRSPRELASHLRNSGGCMVVSRLGGGDAEVLSVLDVQGQRAVEQPGPPCNGVPRLLRDPALNEALGDPLGRARASLPGAERGDELVLQVLLTDHLHDLAQQALRARFGPVSPEEMARRAADAGYELTCFAEPAGAIRCQ